MTYLRDLLTRTCVQLIFVFTMAASTVGLSLSCHPGTYAHNGECALCPSLHYCKGAHAVPSSCPRNSFDFYPGNATNIDDCACNAGFFRTDNAGMLATAIAQGGVDVQDSRVLWCVLCPVGYLCSAPTNGVSSQTEVTECPALATTRLPGSFLLSDCICRAGSYNRTNSTNAMSSCATCVRNSYCLGQDTPPSACPPKTISSAGATSPAGCICLPPLVKLPTFNADFRHDCVVQSAAAFADSGTALDLHDGEYDIFGIQADALFNTYGMAPAAPCVSIETGKHWCSFPLGVKCFAVLYRESH